MITKITNGVMNENCYIIREQTNCVIIDPGYAFHQIMEYINKNNLNIVAVLLTHGHFDHSKSGYELQKLGKKVYIHKLDADKLYTKNNLSYIANQPFDFYYADCLIEEGKLKIADFEFDVIHTPGHSKGSVVFVYKNNVFCGDTIFEHGYGRYDFYDGNFRELMSSIKKLMPYIKNNYNLFYGH